MKVNKIVDDENEEDAKMPATHNLIWHFEAVNAAGDTQRFQCGKAFDLAAWDDPRDAAIFFTMEETLPALAEETTASGGPVWHLTKPASIQVFAVRPLSDTAL